MIFGLDSIYGFLGGSSPSNAAQRTATVALGTVQSSVSASGNVSVATSASANFATSGTLSAVYVRVGSKVRAGETIAKLDPTAAEATLEASQANLAQAQQALATAEAGATAEQQAANASSLQQAQSQLTSAQQQLATDQAAVTAAEKQVHVDQALGCPPAGSTSSSSASSSSASSASNASSQSSTFTSTTLSSTGSQNGTAPTGTAATTSHKGVEVGPSGPTGATGATGATTTAPTSTTSTTTTTPTATGSTGAAGSSGNASSAATAKASPPSAATGQASAIGSTTATLSGTVDPAGSNTTYWFEYGTSASSLGSKTPKLGGGSGTSPVSVTATVNGLKPGHAYLFRLVAESSAGTGTGADVSFATITAATPTVTTGSASSVLTTGATLTGSVDPNGSDTHYRFEYGTTSSYGRSTASQDAGSAAVATQVTATVTGLKPNTPYLFRLVARNGAGTSAGIGQVVKTAESACTADEATIEAAKQTVTAQEQAVKTAEANLAQTQATISASETPSEATIAQDKAAVSQAQATVVSDQKALEATVLKAPVAGTVTAVNGAVGDTVGGSGSSVSKGAANAASSSSSASTGLGGTGSNGNSASSSSSTSTFATIETLNRLQVVSGFAEADATKLAVGQPATVTFPALTDVEVAGKVTAISSTSTVVSNVVTYNATISLIDPPSDVLDGMTANVAVVVDTRSHVLELPSAAITTNGTVSTVQLLQDGKTSTARIQTGIVGDSSTQITGGVALGDVAVVPTVAISARHDDDERCRRHGRRWLLRRRWQRVSAAPPSEAAADGRAASRDRAPPGRQDLRDGCDRGACPPRRLAHGRARRLRRDHGSVRAPASRR